MLPNFWIQNVIITSQLPTTPHEPSRTCSGNGSIFYCVTPTCLPQFHGFLSQKICFIQSKIVILLLQMWLTSLSLLASIHFSFWKTWIFISKCDQFLSFVPIYVITWIFNQLNYPHCTFLSFHSTLVLVTLFSFVGWATTQNWLGCTIM